MSSQNSGDLEIIRIKDTKFHTEADKVKIFVDAAVCFKNSRYKGSLH